MFCSGRVVLRWFIEGRRGLSGKELRIAVGFLIDPVQIEVFFSVGVECDFFHQVINRILRFQELKDKIVEIVFFP